MSIKIDDTDRSILQFLVRDSKTTYQEIADALDVSAGTIHFRVNKLKESGIITGSKVILDNEKLGLEVCAFIGINLVSAKSYGTAQKKLNALSEIVELYYTTGSYSLFAKVLLKGTKHLHHFLVEKLQALPEVQSTETLIVLDQPISREGSFPR